MYSLDIPTDCDATFPSRPSLVSAPRTRTREVGLETRQVTHGNQFLSQGLHKP